MKSLVFLNVRTSPFLGFSSSILLGEKNVRYAIGQSTAINGGYLRLFLVRGSGLLTPTCIITNNILPVVGMGGVERYLWVGSSNHHDHQI